MQAMVTLLMGIAVGIAGYAGVTHLLIGSARRPRDQTHLRFGLTCLAIAAQTAGAWALHSATSVADYLLILKYAIGPSSLAAISMLLWFVASYTAVRPTRILQALSLWYALIVALHLGLPFGILYADLNALRPISLPWGEQIVVAQGTPHPLHLIHQPFYLAMFGYFGYALVQQYRRGEQQPALLLGLALTPLLLARIVDPLVVFGMLDLPLTSHFAFFSLVMVMSLVLSHGVTQTELALQTYQHQLQRLVDTRTIKLTRANRQLAQELQAHARLDQALARRVEQLTALKQVAEIGIRMDDLTSALHAMSQTTTALFDVHATLLLLPAHQRLESHTLIGFARHAGALGPVPIDVALSDLPLTEQVRQLLLLPELHTHPFLPAIQAFVTAQPLQHTMLIPLEVSGTVIGLLIVATDQPDRSFTSDEVCLAETIAGDMSTAINNTRLYQGAVAARARLTLLYQSSQAISQASLDPARIYAELHAAVARLMPAEVFVIVLLDDATHTAEQVYLADRSGRSPGRRYPLAASCACTLFGRNQSVRIDDFDTFSQREAVGAWLGGLPDTASGVMALLRSSERMLGFTMVQSYTKGAYYDHDEAALQLLVAQAAVALEHARRHQEAQDLATTAERTRLARELHDAVTQTLYSASLLAEALPAIWQRSAREGARDLDVLRQLVRGALAEMRTLLFELRPSALVAAELGTLLRQLGDRLTGNSHIPVALTIQGRAEPPIDVKIAVYRMAQEAFNNIVKHADASQVWVTLHTTPNQLCLSVRDDGCGFDPGRVTGEHLGTQIMAERAVSIGARLQIDSAPRCGTEVLIGWTAAETDGPQTTPASISEGKVADAPPAASDWRPHC